MSEYIYFNIWNGHFKMWGFDTFENNDTGEWRLILYWGKIKNNLSKLQKKEKKFDGYWDCFDYIKDTIDGKLRKGYVRLENRVYSQYSCGEITLTELVKKIEEKNGIMVEAI